MHASQMDKSEQIDLIYKSTLVKHTLVDAVQNSHYISSAKMLFLPPKTTQCHETMLFVVMI